MYKYAQIYIQYAYICIHMHPILDPVGYRQAMGDTLPIATGVECHWGFRLSNEGCPYDRERAVCERLFVNGVREQFVNGPRTIRERPEGSW